MIDLDETLFLRNSTEEFLNCAIPSLLALVILRFLDILQPWRWTGGEATRDVWRVRCVLYLLPWTQLIWKRRVAALAAEHLNHPLAAALSADGRQAVIVTVGFGVIVKPLVEALGFGGSRVVAARLGISADRRNGKLAMATVALGEDFIKRSLFVTDSTEDLALLMACAMPLRVIWPNAHYRRALSHVYLPGQYVTQVKHPGERYVFRGILQEDFALWTLASIALAPQPLSHVAGLLFLLLSFWAIYERGYVDNDLVAARYEADPKLTVAYHQVHVATPRWQPWVWALASGYCAVVLLQTPAEPMPTHFAFWAVWLIATSGWFWLYNRCDKATRVWLYIGLQFLRSAAFLALVPSTEIGVLAVAAHISARWVPYLVYRLGRKSWPEVPVQSLRLVFFLMLGMLFVMAFGITPLHDWSVALLLAWNVFRARHELRTILASATRIDV